MNAESKIKNQKAHENDTRHLAGETVSAIAKLVGKNSGDKQIDNFDLEATTVTCVCTMLEVVAGTTGGQFRAAQKLQNLLLACAAFVSTENAKLIGTHRDRTQMMKGDQDAD